MVRTKIILIAIAVLILSPGITLIRPGPAFAHGWKAPAEAAAVPNPVEKSRESVDRGARIYIRSCASCHGPRAQGDGPLATALRPGPADLVKRSKNHSEGDFFWKISVGRGPMPAFKNVLGDRDIWDVINFIKSIGR